MQTRRAFMLSGAALAAAAQSRKIRLALIGCGHRSWGHIQVLKTLPDFEIVALADPTPEFRDRAASLAGGQPALYDDFHRLLAERRDLDAVLVVTPNFLHAEAAIAALEHGVNVLSEKPMATRVEDADRMIAAARRSGKLLQIGLQMRYTPVYEKMNELVRAGRIGAVEFASGNLFRGDWNPRSWRYTDPRTGVATNWRFLSRTAGSSLLEDGIHEIDVLHWMIAAQPARVFATGGNNVLKQRETIDHAGLLVEYDNGVKLQFGFSIFAPSAGPAGRQMLLLGSEGVLQAEKERITIRPKGRGQPEMIDASSPAPAVAAAGADQDSGTYREWAAFARGIRTGEAPRSSGEVAKQVMQIALLAERSIRERRALAWNE